MRTITAPGVEIKEIDKSQYSPAMVGTNCYVMGFANKGEAYLPMEFTSRAAWINYYGEPDNEAEKYFYNACIEVLNNNGRLYCARLPYDNESFEQAVCFKYDIYSKILSELSAETKIPISDGEGEYTYVYSDILNTDNTINEIAYIKPHNLPEMISIDEVDEYRTGENKVTAMGDLGSFVIVDTSFGTLRKVIEKSDRKNKKREVLGIVPVITTAANALLAQNLITVENHNIRYYETIGNIKTMQYDLNNQPINNIISSSTIINPGNLNDELVTQLNTSFKKYILKHTVDGSKILIEKISDIVDHINDIIEDKNLLLTSGQIAEIKYNEDDVQTTVDSLNNVIDTLTADYESTDDIVSKLNSCKVDLNTDTVGILSDNVEKLYNLYFDALYFAPEDGDDTVPDTISQLANNYFTPIEFDAETNTLKRNNLKDIGVVVFKTYIDPSEGNKIRFELVESFVGSLYKDDKDPNTGVTKFIDTIVNTNSQYINFFSNCFANTNAKKYYTDQLDMLIMQPTATCGSLGFFKDQTEEKISLPMSIYEGMNKCFEKISDINERDIDIVCDAGISNIGQYIKTMYGTDGKGYYDIDVRNEQGEPMIGMWKCQSNDDIKVWKTIIQKIDTFCKNVRKDCMFITECPRPLVLAGNKKIVRPSKPKNTIDADILPYVKWITGLNTNYGAGYMDWFEIADEYTGDFFWLPPSIKAMGIYIHTDINYNYWDAPAGLNRGIVSATDVAFSPTGKQAGSIYEKNWNYAINYPQDGIILEGQKTFQVKPSAFDRVNVRRLFLRLERMAYKVARYFVYEGNTAYNRQRLVDAIDPYFKEAKIGGGIYDYKIVCDESNNTPETIDRNELNVSIAIKPTKTIEFIMLNFIAGRTGSTWEELLG